MGAWKGGFLEETAIESALKERVRTRQGKNVTKGF